MISLCDCETAAVGSRDMYHCARLASPSLADAEMYNLLSLGKHNQDVIAVAWIQSECPLRCPAVGTWFPDTDWWEVIGSLGILLSGGVNVVSMQQVCSLESSCYNRVGMPAIQQCSISNL